MVARKGDPCPLVEDGKVCGKPVTNRGWCSMHYARWQTHGDPLHSVRRYVRQGGKCGHETCPRKPDRLGYCNKHAKLFVKYGETTDPRERRFWVQVDKRGPDECWPWLGGCQKNGYGQYGTKGERLVHRIAYEYLVGPIPEGLVLDHLCHTADPQCADNDKCPHRKCANPNHLEPVTRRENIRRGRGGDSWGYVPEPIPVRPVQLALPVCADCGTADKPIYKSGRCRPCYRRWLKDPNVERPSQRTPEQRFWLKVNKRGPVPARNPELGRCWLWTANINPKTGYGAFARRHGEGIDAHRFSYELAHGAIPEKHDVHHKCHVRHCVNPDHLEAVTRAENMRMRKYRRAS